MMKVISVILVIAVIVSGFVLDAEAAKKKGYTFTYSKVKVTMHNEASKLLKKAGKPIEKTESKSCSYDGMDRSYEYDDFIVNTYSNSKKGKEYICRIYFKTSNVKTDKGIKIGSKKADVIKKYGKTKNNYGVYSYTKGDTKLQFEIDKKGIVIAIQYVAL